MKRLRAALASQWAFQAGAFVVGLGLMLVARLWLFDGWQVSYTVAFRLLAAYGAVMLVAFLWRERIYARHIRQQDQTIARLDADLDTLWKYLGPHEQEPEALTSAQRACLTVPDLEAQPSSPQTGRHRHPDEATA